MIALDTNVVVRVLTNDDPAQARRAAGLLAREEVYLPKTAVLESEWVLRHAYGLDRSVISKAFRKFLGLPTVSAEHPTALAQALAWYEGGLDFADALHLSSAREAGATGFATFDREFARKARKLSDARIVIP